jgi:hypothetical protein
VSDRKLYGPGDFEERIRRLEAAAFGERRALRGELKIYHPDGALLLTQTVEVSADNVVSAMKDTLQELALRELVAADTEKHLEAASKEVVAEALVHEPKLPGPPETHIGFWAGPGEHPSLPDPKTLVDKAWRQTEEATIVLSYLRQRALKKDNYRGYSSCRWEGCQYHRKPLGSWDMTDNYFVWPEGYIHYVDHHAVKPPEHFIRAVLAQLGLYKV